jgi:DNA-binding response OmpR family regulator
MTYLPRILLIDDEKDFLYLSTSLLRRHGFDVYSMSNTDEVLPTVQRFGPQIIIIDVRLAKYDGRMLCRQLKVHANTNGAKVLLHSTLADLEKEYDQYGAAEFLLKPYSIDFLLSRISYHLKM